MDGTSSLLRPFATECIDEQHRHVAARDQQLLATAEVGERQIAFPVELQLKEMTLDLERRSAEIHAAIDEDLVRGIEPGIAAAVVHIEELELVEQFRQRRERKPPEVRWKAVEGLHPGDGEVAMPTRLQE